MEHVGIVVDHLAATTAFFVEVGLELLGEGTVEGGWLPCRALPGPAGAGHSYTP